MWLTIASGVVSAVGLYWLAWLWRLRNTCHMYCVVCDTQLNALDWRCAPVSLMCGHCVCAGCERMFVPSVDRCKQCNCVLARKQTIAKPLSASTPASAAGAIAAGASAANPDVDEADGLNGGLLPLPISTPLPPPNRVNSLLRGVSAFSSRWHQQLAMQTGDGAGGVGGGVPFAFRAPSGGVFELPPPPPPTPNRPEALDAHTASAPHHFNAAAAKSGREVLVEDWLVPALRGVARALIAALAYAMAALLPATQLTLVYCDAQLFGWSHFVRDLLAFDAAAGNSSAGGSAGSSAAAAGGMGLLGVGLGCGSAFYGAARRHCLEPAVRALQSLRKRVGWLVPNAAEVVI